jgi:hypothetical protein
MRKIVCTVVLGISIAMCVIEHFYRENESSMYPPKI